MENFCKKNGLEEAKDQNTLKRKYSEETIKKIYSNKSTSHGLTYEIKKLKNNEKIQLMLEVTSNLYWGFCFIDTNGEYSKNLYNIEEELNKLGFKKDKWWWKYLYDEKNNEIKLKELDSELACIIMDDEKLKKLVINLVDRIRADYDKIANELEKID